MSRRTDTRRMGRYGLVAVEPATWQKFRSNALMTGKHELEGVAKELFWWQAPEVALANPRRFLAQVMTLGTWQEVQLVKDAFGWGAFKDALMNAPAGVFDGRSWAYWHAFFGLPEAELPRRSLPDIPDLQPLPGGISPATI